MDIEVELSSSATLVELNSSSSLEVTTNVPTSRFSDLLDFDDDNKNDQYLIMYNASTQKYELVNPDKVLSSAAADEPIQPGLPGDFINSLDTDLNRPDNIDLDAGSF